MTNSWHHSTVSFIENNSCKFLVFISSFYFFDRRSYIAISWKYQCLIIFIVQSSFEDFKSNIYICLLFFKCLITEIFRFNMNTLGPYYRMLIKMKSSLCGSKISWNDLNMQILIENSKKIVVSCYFACIIFWFRCEKIYFYKLFILLQIMFHNFPIIEPLIMRW